MREFFFHKIPTLESGDDFIHVMVTDPHKVGDGMSSFIGEYSCDKITTT